MASAAPIHARQACDTRGWESRRAFSFQAVPSCTRGPTHRILRPHRAPPAPNDPTDPRSQWETSPDVQAVCRQLVFDINSPSEIAMALMATLRFRVGLWGSAPNPAAPRSSLGDVENDVALINPLASSQTHRAWKAAGWLIHLHF